MKYCRVAIVVAFISFAPSAAGRKTYKDTSEMDRCIPYEATGNDVFCCSGKCLDGSSILSGSADSGLAAVSFSRQMPSAKYLSTEQSMAMMLFEMPSQGSVTASRCFVRMDELDLKSLDFHVDAWRSNVPSENSHQ